MTPPLYIKMLSASTSCQSFTSSRCNLATSFSFASFSNERRGEAATIGWKSAPPSFCMNERRLVSTAVQSAAGCRIQTGFVGPVVGWSQSSRCLGPTWWCGPLCPLFTPLSLLIRRRRMAHKQIYYSDKYFDEHYEYRHVMLPRELSKQVPKTHLMSEEEWRRLGVQQSLGWVHYMIHEPEPHILLFRRPLPKDQQK
ncbi:PREDICTED: cyclin-dependent kinases regulatory subunit 2 [Condylura cristata]|nr:PREDICTED: cyclin-dependent kinases regulatory subunit 2 [Condylura cristata]